LAACLYIALYIQDECSYDRFHPHFAQIYRLTEIQKQADGYHPVAVTPGPLAAALQQDFPEIVQSTRVGRWGGLFQSNDIKTEPKHTLIAENSFFKIFGFKLLMGNPETVLQNPDELIISETIAKQFFGNYWRDSSVLGQTVLYNNQDPLTVVGVVQTVPANSHLQFDVLLPFKYLEKTDPGSNQWNSNNYHTYLQLKPETKVSAFQEKIAKQLRKYANNNDAILQLQPLRDIFLYSKFDFETDFGKRGNIFYVRIFLLVGLIVLLIAVVNFINLSTARASRRAREVGVRKSVGAHRHSLIAQFLSESLLLSAISVGAALLLAQAALPLFNTLAGKQLIIPFELYSFWLTSIGTTLVLSLLTGGYPAFFLSSFRPSTVLKGTLDNRSGTGFRKMLVVGQFMLAIVLSIGAIVIYQQLNFVQNKNLGFDQSQLLYVRLKGELRGKSGVLKNELSHLPGIRSVTATTSNLVEVSNSANIEWEGQSPKEELLITQMNVDADFLPTTGMTIAAGRNFSSTITSDTLEKSGRFLVNESAAQRMGYNRETALGKKVKFWGLDGEIIGVLNDFHFQPLSKTIEPFIFRYRPRDFYFNLLLKIQSDDLPSTIAAVESIYKKLDPVNPFSYGFVDQDLEAQYLTDRRTGNIIFCFSLLAVLIACFGLFGLAAFTAEVRTKEIGVRKVLGASIASITGLLTRDFLKLVLIALLIAAPIAHYFMQQWLADFAYRIDMQWWMFALAGLVSVVIACLTVGFQSIKAALANPVTSLRSE